MDKFFKISERKSSIKTEIIAGLTTFFAMAYIIFVNPDLLSKDFAANMPYLSVFTATCIAAAIGTFLTAFLANAPFAQAPGMGLNAFFTFTVCLGMGYTYQQALTIVLLSGILFLIVAVSPLRKNLIAAIPASLKAAISAGIGLFIAFIGVIGSGFGVIKLNSDSHITEIQFKLPTEDGKSILNYGALITLAGIVIIAVLLAFKVKGGIFFGIIITAVLYYAIGIPTGYVDKIHLDWSARPTLEGTFFAFDFKGLVGDNHGVMALITAIISFALIDCFDTIGTLVGTAGNAGLLKEDGEMEGGDKALIADAIATCTGACLGTSTVTTYVESSAGISAGGRTGLSSIVVGILFLVSLVLAPVVGLIPAAATAPALIIVGVLMFKGASRIEWDDMEVAIPAFLTIAMMPFAYSISDGIAFGFISYTLIKVFKGKFKEVPVLLYIVSALFIAMYVLKYFNA